MRSTQMFLILLLLGVLAFVGSANAEPLSHDEISGFIASLSDMEDLGKKYENDEGLRLREEEALEHSQSVEEFNWMSASIAAIKGHPAYDEFEEIAEDHGFSSPEEWGEVGDRVLKAFMAASMDANAREMQAQMEETLRELENNPDISPEQKQMMRDSMGSGMAQFKAMTDAPAADIEAVKPFLPELRRAFDSAAGEEP